MAERRVLAGATRVDEAEAALRAWLSPGRHRPGDRLPPEHELAAMLSVSRGTLRAALGRLERAGEIVRRRGSGTFVGELPRVHEFSAGLELLESYSLLARRQGLTLTVRDLTVRRGTAGAGAEASLGLAAGIEALVVERVLVADGEPAAWMRDVTLASLPLPSQAVIERALRGGSMLLDVLERQRVPVAFARTRVDARLLDDGDPVGRALEVRQPMAALELVETMHLRDGAAVQHSENVFAPGRLRLHVMRALATGEPVGQQHGIL